MELGLDGEVTRVNGNADSLRILARNLIDNAVRYTPRGGRVDARVDARVNARVNAGVTANAVEARLEVCDTGPGIPAQERARVFDRFYRREGMEAPGSGLGLSIVRRIAERHGARVELADGPGGRGLRAVVSFPVGSGS